MLNQAIQRLQGLRQGAPTGYAPPGYVDSNMGMPANQFAPPQGGNSGMLMGAPVTTTAPPTEPTAGAAGGLSSQNRLALLKNMIMRRIAQRMQGPEMQAQLPQQAGRNPGYLANMILGRPVSQAMAGQIQPQSLSAGAVAPAPAPATTGAANAGSAAQTPSITSNITQSGEGGQTIQSTGSLTWSPGRVRK